MGISQCSHDDDGNILQLLHTLNPPAGLNPVHPGHHHIHQNQIGRSLHPVRLLLLHTQVGEQLPRIVKGDMVEKTGAVQDFFNDHLVDKIIVHNCNAHISHLFK
ncbi:hypothetical protein D3C75_866320 [compost metagenome]